MAAPQSTCAEGVSDKMTHISEEDRILAGEYALGLLDGAQATYFEDRLNREPDLRAAYAAWADDFATMNEAGEAPPAAMKSRIDRALFGEPRRAPGWLWGLGTAVAAVLALVVFVNLQFVSEENPTADYVASVDVENLDFTVEVFLDEYVLILPTLSSMPPASKDHELWIIPAGGTPISLGVMGISLVNLPSEIELEGALIAVTIEEIGGSVTGAPTTTPIAAVPLTPA